MAAHPGGGSSFGDRGDGIDDAVRVRGGGAGHQHGLRADGGGHVGGGGPQRGRRHGHRVHGDPQVVRRLGERGVRAGRHHDPGCRDLRVGVPGGLDGEDQRLGAAAGDAADDVRRGAAGAPAEQPGGSADQRVLHRQQRREGGRVEPVDVGAAGVRGGGQLVQPRHGRVVDVREQPPPCVGRSALRSADTSASTRSAGSPFPGSARRSVPSSIMESWCPFRGGQRLSSPTTTA